MSAADVTDAPWVVVVDDDEVWVMVDDDDTQETVCNVPACDDDGSPTPLAERVVVADRIVADHRAARVRIADHRRVMSSEVPW